jgi:TRAP-type mannitol/chloroaromatic compound transport system permease small subunit
VEVDTPRDPVGGSDVAAGLVRWLGHGISWFTLVMVFLIFGIVVARYGFNQGWIWMQESVTYLHALVFMVASAWAFQTDDHVRVDIFYRSNSSRYKNWVNLLGTLLLLVPFSLFLTVIGWDYVAASWETMESSREPGGLPLVFLLKSLILILPVLLLIQSWSTARTCISALRKP